MIELSLSDAAIWCVVIASITSLVTVPFGIVFLSSDKKVK